MSTAIYAIVKRDGAADPASMSEATLTQLRTAIQNDAAKQDEVVNVAAAIKAVVDYGASVGLANGATNTLALAEYVVGQSASDANADDQFLVDLKADAGITADLVAEVTGDPIVGSQLITAKITAADLTGKRFAIGEDTLMAFGSAGVLTVYDYDSIVGTPDTGTWSMDEANQVLTITIGNSFTATMRPNGGSLDTAIPVAFSDGTANQNLVLYRAEEATAGTVTNLSQLWFGYDGFMAYIPSVCDGVTEGFLADDAGFTTPVCEIKNGALVFGSAPLPATAPAWVDFEGQYDVHVALGGTSTSRLNLASWHQDPVDGTRSTDYGSLYAPIDTVLPVNGGILRIGNPKGDVQLVIADDDLTSCTSSATTGCARIYFEDAGDGTTPLPPVDRHLTLASGIGVDYLFADDDADPMNGNVVAVLRLNGSTSTVYKEAFVYEVTVDVGGDTFTHTVGTTTSAATAYKLADFAAPHVSGKTFSFVNHTGTSSGTVTFDADGTLVVTQTAGGTENGSWVIEPASTYPVAVLKVTWADGSISYMFNTAVDMGKTHIIANLRNEGSDWSVTSLTMTEQ